MRLKMNKWSLFLIKSGISPNNQYPRGCLKGTLLLVVEKIRNH